MTAVQHMLTGLRNRHFFVMDLMVLALAPFVALYLRIDKLTPPAAMLHALLFYACVALVLRMTVFVAGGVYQRYWRFAGVEDLSLIGRLHLLASALLLFFFAALATAGGPLCRAAPIPCGLPRTVPLIDAVLVFLAMGGLRYGARLLQQQQRRSQAPPTVRQRVVVVGAGETGALVIREMRENPAAAMDPVALIDDDPVKQGVKIHGVPVLGRVADITTIVDRTAVSHVVVAMPSAPGAVIRAIHEQCAAIGAGVRVMPGLSALLDGQVSINRLRRVELEDLLRREPVHTDTAALTALLRGRRVLVTGGGGSIGREICRQVLRCAPSTLIILGHGENSIFECAQELQGLPAARGAAPTTIQPVIADVRFQQRIAAIFAAHRPDVVFHAAAHKHVPLMEENPGEAVTNNVLGTWNVLRAASAAGVAHFVLISTDKAVNPTSVMGATKRVAELLVHRYAAATGRAYQAVRFGNVLGSRGSVVLTFNRQIAAGGPVTVTHPEVRRFFMTIPEAVQLTLQAAALGQGGEVFMLDMGQPIKIADMARDLIKLSGLRPEVDIAIQYTGLRPGEKLYEELFVPGEEYLPTRHAKIFHVVLTESMPPALLESTVQQLLDSAERGDVDTIHAGLRKLVPEYVGGPLAGRDVRLAITSGERPDLRLRVSPSLP